MTDTPGTAKTSGDLIADRRFAWAAAAAQDGRHDEAGELLAQVLERAPDWAAAWHALGVAQEACGRREAAVAAYARALACEPDDPLGTGLRLARLEGVTPARAPDAYVRQLFDGYATRFETHLVGGLGYRGPALLRAAVEAVCTSRGRAPAFAHALDLGCGTGLAAQAFAPLCGALDGVDLSPAMVRAARATGLYAHVETGELGAWLAGRAAAGADLVVAADVFIYVGALEAVLAGLSRALAPGGLSAATLQSEAGAGFSLGDDLRYAHSEAYLRRTAHAAGLEIARLEPQSFRRERGVDVPGLVVVLARP